MRGITVFLVDINSLSRTVFVIPKNKQNQKRKEQPTKKFYILK